MVDLHGTICGLYFSIIIIIIIIMFKSFSILPSSMIMGNGYEVLSFKFEFMICVDYIWYVILKYHFIISIFYHIYIWWGHNPRPEWKNGKGKYYYLWKFSLWAYNSMTVEKICSHSTFSQTPHRTTLYSVRNILKSTPKG